VKNAPINDEMNLIDIPTDGNCLFSAILASTNTPIEYNKKLRIKSMEYLANNKNNLQDYFKPVAYEILGSENIEEYIEYMSRNNVHAGDPELNLISQLLNCGISVLVLDNSMQIINKLETNDKQSLITIAFKQGNFGARDKNGHYWGVNIKDNNIDVIKGKMLNLLNIKNEIEKIAINMMIWNCRSIIDNTKKKFLVNQLYLENIDIALIQETHLKNTDKFYIKGYRIFRSNNENARRKGCAILISNRLNVNVDIVDKDNVNGRFIKLNLICQETNNIRSISSIYLEPQSKYEIPCYIFESDIIGSDLNDYSSLFEKYKVYHYKQIQIVKNINLPNIISDHEIIIGKSFLPFNKTELLEKKIILDNDIANRNFTSLCNYLINHDKNPSLKIMFEECRKVIYEDQYNISDQSDLYSNFKEIKEKALNDFKEQYNLNISRMNAKISISKISSEDWSKISHIIGNKNNFGLYSKDHNFDKVIEGFKVLYNNSSNYNHDWVTWNNYLINLIKLIKESKELIILVNIKLPKSLARDINGFRQKDFFSFLLYPDMIERVCYMFEEIMKSDSRFFFFHNKVKIVLFNKIENPTSYKDLRGIGIIPVFLMILKKN
jgi:hypothetical protein